MVIVNLLLNVDAYKPADEFFMATNERKMRKKLFFSLRNRGACAEVRKLVGNSGVVLISVIKNCTYIGAISSTL